MDRADENDALAALLESGRQNEQRARDAQKARELHERRRVEFLADFATLSDSLIRPTLKEIAQRVESARKLGRFSVEPAAKMELGAEVLGREVHTELRLVQGRAATGLRIKPDELSQRVAIAHMFGYLDSPGDLTRDGRTTDVTVAELTPEYLSQRIEQFFVYAREWLSKALIESPPR